MLIESDDWPAVGLSAENVDNKSNDLREYVDVGVDTDSLMLMLLLGVRDEAKIEPSLF